MQHVLNLSNHRENHDKTTITSLKTEELSYTMYKRALSTTMAPFGSAYFRVYIKQLMQKNKFLCIIYKFLR